MEGVTMEGSLQWMREQSRKKMFQNFFAELLGTFILVLMGDGAIAQHVLSKGARGDFGNVSLGYGLALMIGITVSGGVSGGHLNPAVSLAMWVLGKMSRRGLFIYWAAQYIGAILASGVLLAVYSDAVHEFEGNSGNLTLATAGIWASFPSPNISATQAAVDQVVGTAVLLVIILAVTDSKNMNIPQHLVPLYIGLGLASIHMSLALNAGCAINPARDLGPRLFTAIAGWGTTPFTAANYWFWIPWILPHLGAMVGVVVYMVILIGHSEPNNNGEGEKNLEEIKVRTQKP